MTGSSLRPGRVPGSGTKAPPSVGDNSKLIVDMVDIALLTLSPARARRFDRAAIKAAANIIRRFPPRIPVAVDPDNVVVVGDLLVLAARLLKLDTLPVTRVDGLSAVELEAMAVAYARLFELGEWDKAQLGTLALRFEVEIPAFDAQDLGFEITEIDLAIGAATVDPAEDEEIPALSARPVSQVGDVWMMRRHRLICGDSTDASAFHRLMAGASARAIFTDPPFGCPIDGFVSGKGRHREFVMGSGEMTPAELGTFFREFIDLAAGHVKPGALVYLVIDWRSLHSLLDAATPILGDLINMAVWVKDRAGMGSFLRSRHELVLIFKVKGGRARNNVMLGRNGRDRSNVWSYPSAKTASKGSDEGNMLAHHPTPKPIALVADAILDCTSRGDIVLDPFLGSGTTLIAAEKVGRACYAAELDPLYADLAVRRWQAWTGEAAVHEATGKTFDEISAEADRGNHADRCGASA